MSQGFTQHIWANKTLDTFQDLVDNPLFLGAPDSVTAVDYRFQTTINITGVFVKRYISSFIAPQTGNYYFWIAANQKAVLHLSESMDFSLTTSICESTTQPPPTSLLWTRYSEQKSALIPLIAGTKYYLLVIHTDPGDGVNHCAVGWQLPSSTTERPIPATYLSTEDYTVINPLKHNSTSVTNSPKTDTEAEQTKFPSSSVDSDEIGDEVWQDPSNATTDDGLSASVLSSVSSASHYLKMTDFGFSLPSDAVVTGIVADIFIKGASGDFASLQNSIKLVKSDDSLSTEDKSTGDILPTSFTTVSFGSPTSLWGETWTASNINSENFGVAVSVAMRTTWLISWIDYSKITVYYTQGNCVTYSQTKNSSTPTNQIKS